MNERIIKISNYTEIESLKMYILQRLKLVNYKTDDVSEFYERIENYIHRNKSLIIVFQLDRNKIEKDLKFNLSLTRFQELYPDNFEMGNPHNRWLNDPIIRTAEESKREELEFEKSFKDKLLTLNQFFSRLGQIGCGQILVKDS